uniref:Uncharacterized protein n=1 Tax=Arundo donax TaxID=35708 RepID=A0A0A9CYG0_ARUDO
MFSVCYLLSLNINILWLHIHVISRTFTVVSLALQRCSGVAYPLIYVPDLENMSITFKHFGDFGSPQTILLICRT